MAPKRALTESDAPAAKRARSQRAAPKTKTAPAPAQKNASKKAVAIPKKPVAPSKKTKSDDDSAPAAKRIKITKSSNSSPKTRPKAVPKTRVQKVLPTLQGAPTERLIILACGEGSAGELGLGTKKSTDVKRPRINAFLDSNTVGVVQMSAGGMHCIALTHDNKILTWGVNDNAALGRDTAWEGGLVNADGDSDSDSDDESDTGLNPQESTPAEVLTEHFPAGTVFVQVAAGDSTSFVLTNTGLVYGWGTFRDGNGVFGFSLDKDHKIIETQRTPLLIPGLKNVMQISVGADYALALDKKGDIYGWGNGQQDQLGRRLIDRRRADALLPNRVPLPHTKKIASVFACSNHAFAIDVDGNTWAWGLNNFAQTGIDNGAGEDGGSVTAPTKVPALNGLNMKMLAGGTHHSIACSNTGKTFVWGRLDGSQMGIDMSKLPLDNEELVRKDDRDLPRILLKPTPLSISCSYVAAASEHNIAITKDGKAYSWGFNGNYQCGQGDEDEIKVATLIDNTAVRGKHLVWAGTGGQYSMFAAKFDPTVQNATASAPLVNGSSRQPLTNGVNGH